MFSLLNSFKPGYHRYTPVLGVGSFSASLLRSSFIKSVSGTSS